MLKSVRRCVAASAVMVLALSGCSQTAGTTPSTQPTTPAKAKAAFDLEAHRGGRGETTEESKRAFEKALDLGVTTLELDIVITKDKVPAVWHDPGVLADKCEDTQPATPGDPQFPYVGKDLHDLTWPQIQTLNCGKTLKNFPNAEAVADNKIMKLGDLFTLVEQRKADVRFNIETKLEAIERSRSATPEEFVDVILATVREHKMVDKVMIQTFDWRTLPLVHKAEPSIPLVALWDETTWIDGSPWIADVNFRGVGGDVIKGAAQVNATILSPGYAVPYGMKAGDQGFFLIANKDFCDRAHAAGMKVVPWTINDAATMKAQIDAGADGIISDYPTLLRSVMAERGMALPTPYPAK